VIPEDKIAEIQERTDIVALVGDYVRLKKAGASFKGLCPFHDEKTPSFHVMPDRRFFHCFGCHASGDVIRFYMQIEGLSFPEACDRLAERAGVDLPRIDSADARRERAERERRETRYAIMDEAAGFYLRSLEGGDGAELAREAIDARGVTAETARNFRLGYAPDSWDALVRFLESRKIDLGEAEALGLVVSRKSGSGYYDRFRHRLLFPIADLHGRIVAFSGRVLPPRTPEPPGQEKPAKYINSPESPIYKKGEILYGLFEGRLDARRRGELVLCEGNFDVLALHQAGLRNSVAPMGTAFTEAHARLIRRFADRAALIFDGDAAGLKAVSAAHPLLAKVGVAARVVAMPAGDDPDSFLRREGAGALETKLAAAPGIIDFLVDGAARQAGDDPSERSRAIASLAPVLACIDSPVERQLYEERVARRFGMRDVGVVRRELRRGAQSSSWSDRRVRAGDETPREQAPYKPHAIEAEVLGMILDHPALLSEPEAEKVPELLTDEGLRAIFREASEMLSRRGTIDGASLVQAVEGRPVKAWLESRLAVSLIGEKGAREGFRVGVLRLAKRQIEQELPRLRARILDARRAGDDSLAESLMTERVVLERAVRELDQELSLAMSRGASLGQGSTTRH
jgi:DNA primase